LEHRNHDGYFIYSHLMPNIEGAAAAVDGVLRAAINKRAEDLGSKAVANDSLCSPEQV
jgi:hypothetical protein